MFDLHFDPNLGVWPIEIDPIFFRQNTFRLEGGSQGLKYLGDSVLKFTLTGVIEAVLLE